MARKTLQQKLDTFMTMVLVYRIMESETFGGVVWQVYSDGNHKYYVNPQGRIRISKRHQTLVRADDLCAIQAKQLQFSAERNDARENPPKVKPTKPAFGSFP